MLTLLTSHHPFCVYVCVCVCTVCVCICVCVFACRSEKSRFYMWQKISNILSVFLSYPLSFSPLLHFTCLLPLLPVCQTYNAYFQIHDNVTGEKSLNVHLSRSGLFLLTWLSSVPPTFLKMKYLPSPLYLNKTPLCVDITFLDPFIEAIQAGSTAWWLGTEQ